MASTSPTLSAHRTYPVQLKINYEGVVRRIKMPLCDLSPTSLELKVRTDLEIPAEVPCTIERYSDSAARYITLDRDDLSVYKQLYRAAKSKKKLKLRVRAGIPGSASSTGPPTPSHASPSLEHKSEDAPQDETNNNKSKKPCKLDNLSTTAKQSGLSYSLSALSPGEGFQESLAKMMREQLNIEQDIEALEATLAAALHTDATGAPPPHGFKPSSEKEKEVSGRRTPVLVLRQPAESAPEVRAEAEQASTESLATTSPTPPLVNTSDPTDTIPSNYTVCCNSCDRTISAAHYHCSTCDDGDFDLCTACVDAGITCHGADSHWLIKRFIQNGNIINSTTQRITPQPKSASVAAAAPPPSPSMHTCNACIDELPESEFLHCMDCEDFDLCRTCFVKDQHGHHPGHAFQPLINSSLLTTEIKRRLPPGRGQTHAAICDGCDEDIVGVRHKCLDCPDWDYCSACIETSSLAHPGHRFARLYEPITFSDAARLLSCLQPTHHGVRCDGPHCKTRGFQLFIRGDRYKCAVCHDTDFCARCEASPENPHNKSHPLIKFKTPIRSVSVFTTEHGGKSKPTRLMGDRCAPTPTTTTEDEDAKPSLSSSGRCLSTSTRCRLRECTSQPAVAPSELPNTAGKVSPVTSSPAPSEEQPTQGEITAVAPSSSENEESATDPDRHDLEEDLADVTATAKDKATEAQSCLAELGNLYPPVKTATCVDQALVYNDLTAAFVRESVTDGTVMPPNHLFEQTWVLRNDGVTTWPAGCVVKFVGGDYMGQIDPNHPVDICSLNSAFCSNPSHVPVAPRQRYAFTVPMRTPPREGTFISYWRLTIPNGHKFGHRLWCDVRVRAPPSHDDEDVKNVPQSADEKDAAVVSEVSLGETTVDERDADNNPVAAAVVPMDETPSEEVKPVEPEPSVAVAEPEALSPQATPSLTEVAKADEEFDQCEEIDAWAEDGSGDEFMTDEEYDILDASDEEFNDQQLK